MAPALTQQSTELAVLTAALAVSYIAHRRRQQPQSDLVAAELEKAEARVVALRAQLQLQPRPTKSIGRKEIRIFMDGAFDLFHYGHANAFRQGLALGTYLVVGVNDDASITECKGAPLCNDEERLAMVRGCKFVDEVRRRPRCGSRPCAALGACTRTTAAALPPPPPSCRRCRPAATDALPQPPPPPPSCRRHRRPAGGGGGRAHPSPITLPDPNPNANPNPNPNPNLNPNSQVVEHVPYVMTDDYLHWVIQVGQG